MQSAKETAANVAASAKSGMEKTKATMQEKAERMTARDPLQKEMATDKKDERIYEAERQKQDTRAHNAPARQGASGGGALGQDYTTGGDYSTTTGPGMTGLHPTGGGTGTTGLHPTSGGTGTTGLHPTEDPNVGRGGRGGTY